MPHSTRRVHKLFLSVQLTFVMLLVSSKAMGQTYLDETGNEPFSINEPVELGFINLSNGNLHIEIPLGSRAQRGRLGYAPSLVYNSRVWAHGPKNTDPWHPVTGMAAGWRLEDGFAGGTSQTKWTKNCSNGEQADQYKDFYFSDASRTRHYFSFITSPLTCGGGSITHNSGYADDNSGYFMEVTNFTDAIVYAKDGTKVYPGLRDTNGNFLGNGVDTLGRNTVRSTQSGVQIFYDVVNSQGQTARYTVTTTIMYAQTNFGQTGRPECAGAIACPMTLVTRILLPDGVSAYTFTYDPSYGELTSVRLPTGGLITYGYTNFSDSNSDPNRWVVSRAINGGTWNYTPTAIHSCQAGPPGCQQAVTVTTPTGDKSVYNFTGGPWLTSLTKYKGAGPQAFYSLVREYGGPMTCSVAPCVPARSARVSRDTTTSAVPSGSLTRKTEYTYDPGPAFNIIAVKDWKYTSSTFSANPDRELDTSYVTDPAYTDLHMLTLPLNVTVKDGAGTQVAQTNYTYDPPGLTLVTGTPNHDDANYGIAATARGNVASIQKWVSGTNYLTTSFTYDTTGQVLSVMDPVGAVTSYSYADRFFTDGAAVSNPPTSFTPTQPTNAYPTRTTTSLGSEDRGYYFDSGALAYTRDVNGNDAYQHFIDPMDRRTHTFGQLTGSARAWSFVQYTSATQTDAYTTINDASASPGCTSCVHAQSVVDSWARVLSSTLVSDPDGATSVNSVYNSSGRVASVSHPHRTTPSTTDGLETPAYDGLGRVTSLTHPDGKKKATFYGSDVTTNGGRGSQLCSTATYGMGYPVLAIDEAGKRHQAWLDGFNRVVEVDEPDSSNSLVTPQTLATCYLGDVRGNLIQSVQGSQVRNYGFADGLSRITSTTLPESGTTSIFYTTSGGLLCAGDASKPCRKIDARGVTTTFVYDSLGRPTEKSYSDGTTPTVRYAYDGGVLTGCNGPPPTLAPINPMGHRTAMCDGSGATSWSYDAGGRILTERRRVTGVTKSVSFTYTLGGAVSSITYSSAKTVTYTYDTAGRQLSAVDTTNSINFATGAHYAPAGQLLTYKNGASGSFAGITVTDAYNNRLELVDESVITPTQTIKWLTHGYDLGAGNNNGTIASITNHLDTGRSQTFTYDELNRIQTAQSQATSGTTCWGQSFTYDRWSNLLGVSPTKCGALPLSVTVDGGNHITNGGFTYDLSGNLLTEGSGTGAWTYSWDAENQLKTASGPSSVTFFYDGDGVRVKKNNGTLYWRMPGGRILARTDLTGTILGEHVYFAGRDVALMYTSATPNYIFQDALGGDKLVTSATGVVCSDVDTAPFGSEVVFSAACDPGYRFAALERDSESSGLDYAMARYYDSRLGRFLSPDGMSGNLGDPQSLNLYAYVRNNPATLTDPMGLCAASRDGDGCAFGGTNGGFGLNSGCMLDGSRIPCGLLGILIRADAAVNCPACQPGQTVGVDNKVYEYKWVKPYLLSFGSIKTTNCSSVWSYCTGDVYIKKVPGHFSLQSSGSLDTGPVEDVYPPMARQLFLENRQIWQNANQITDPRTIALWYGAAALPAVVANASEIAAAARELSLAVEVAYPGTTAQIMDVLQQATPPTNIPSKLAGAAWFVGERISNWYSGSSER